MGLTSALSQFYRANARKALGPRGRLDTTRPPVTCHTLHAVRVTDRDSGQSRHGGDDSVYL